MFEFFHIEPAAWILIIGFSLFMTLIYALCLWYMKTHPMTGVVMGKIKREEKQGKNILINYVIVLKDKRNRTANIIINKDVWENINIDDSYSMSASDHYSME